VPDFGALADAVRALARYGLHTSALVAPGAPLFDAALALLPDHALDVYALAGGLDLRELAVRASAHLLSFPLSSLTDVTAEVMGASYLKRLFCTRPVLPRLAQQLTAWSQSCTSVASTRSSGCCLSRIKSTRPHCSVARRSVRSSRVRGRWCPPTSHGTAGQASVEIFPGVGTLLLTVTPPDVLPSAIEAAVKPLEDGLSCELCRIVLGERLQTLITHWSMVKVNSYLLRRRRWIA
jgi:hypothetical protein